MKKEIKEKMMKMRIERYLRLNFGQSKITEDE